MTVERLGREARSGAGAAGSHVALDPVAHAKPLQVFDADVQAEARQMGTEVADPIRRARMAQEINERLELPPIRVAKRGTALRFFRVRAGEFDRAFELPQQARRRKGGAEEIDRGATESRRGYLFGRFALQFLREEECAEIGAARAIGRDQLLQL